MAEIDYPGPAGALRGYLARPVSEGAHAGVLVIQDVMGLGDDIRQQADRLAAAGYLALAPDLYAGRGPRCVAATLRASRSGRGRAYQEIAAARATLTEREDCTGSIGIIGFCMGGGFALLCAPTGDYAAAAVNYGEVPGDAAGRLRDACPVVASYGGRDPMLRGRAARLERALTEAGVVHDVKEYPGVGHSFMNRFSTGPLMGPLLRVGGIGYDHAASEDAWRRILTFFSEHL